MSRRANFKSQGPWELFLNQEVGVRWDASWAVPDMVQNATFNWDFVGIPGGNQALVADVMVVSKTAANLEEAYQFRQVDDLLVRGLCRGSRTGQSGGLRPQDAGFGGR